MRCPDCNKFVSQEAGDPETSEDVSGDTLTVEVRIVQNCVECGTELKESTLTLERDLSDEGHDGDAKFAGVAADPDERETARQLCAALYALLTDLGDGDILDAVDAALAACEVEHDLEVTDVSLDNDSWSSGKGRGLRTCYGVSGSVAVSCSCGWAHEIEIAVTDGDAYCEASAMESLS